MLIVDAATCPDQAHTMGWTSDHAHTITRQILQIFFFLIKLAFSFVVRMRTMRVAC